MLEQSGRESITAFVAEKAREPVKFLPLIRQRVGLLVGHHLQPMLDNAQEAIGFGKVARCLRTDPAAFRKIFQRHERLALAQLAMPPACDQLLSLNEEFDFADAAAAE